MSASVAKSSEHFTIMLTSIPRVGSSAGLNPLYAIAVVVCAAVPTAKTVYILAGEYKVEEPLVAATVSITTLLSVVTLLGWLYALSGLGAQAS